MTKDVARKGGVFFVGELYFQVQHFENKKRSSYEKVSKNERTTVVTVVSGKHLDSRVQTESIGIKKGTLATPSGEQAPNNTPKASRGTDSTDNISQNAENVNFDSQKGKKFARSDSVVNVDSANETAACRSISRSAAM